MTIRVMTYNVRYFGHAMPARGISSTRAALARITGAVATLPWLPQVICLQEVEQRSLRSALSHTKGDRQETQIQAFMRSLEVALAVADAAHRYVAYYFPAHAYRIGAARLYTTGLAILVRDDVKVLDHNADAPHDITHRRIGAVARVKQSRICAHATLGTAQGEVFQVFNTHLSLPAFLGKGLFRLPERMGYGDNQLHEIDALGAFIDDHRQSDRFVVMGDFNTLPGSPAYDHALVRLGVRDPFPEVLGHSVDALRTQWPTAGFLRYRMRLDHILAGPGVEWIDFEDTQPFGVVGRWHELSDHVPILGRFRVRTARHFGLTT